MQRAVIEVNQESIPEAFEICIAYAGVKKVTVYNNKVDNGQLKVKEEIDTKELTPLLRKKIGRLKVKGEKIDTEALTASLRKKIGYAKLLQEEVKVPSKKEGKVKVYIDIKQDSMAEAIDLALRFKDVTKAKRRLFQKHLKVIGEGIDGAALTDYLKEKLGYANLVDVKKYHGIIYGFIRPGLSAVSLIADITMLATGLIN